MSRPAVVLDASAVLAVANAEPGADRVVGRPAVMSAVNAAEVAARLLRGGVPAAEIGYGIDTLVTAVLPFDRAAADATAALHVRTRPHGLSLADCACLELGRRLGLPVLTTDREWAKVDGVGPVELIR